MKLHLAASQSASADVDSAKATLEVWGHSVCAFDGTSFKRASLTSEHPATASANGDAGKRQSIDVTDKEKRANIALAHKRANADKQQVFAMLAECDAVLVVNPERDGVPGYIGAGVLMEVAVAHSLGKPIFLLHPLPSAQTHRWAHEVAMLQPTVLNGNLSNLPSSGRWEGLG